MSARPLASASPPRLLSVVIPARDEEDCVADTVLSLSRVLKAHAVPHEIVVVDDGSVDATAARIQALHVDAVPALVLVENPPPHGFGRAVRRGIQAARGDALILVMADASDEPLDVVRCWRALGQGWDCVFGSRFEGGDRAHGYPPFKRVLNRLGNRTIQALLDTSLDDTTNAFKAYRRHVIDGCQLLRADHFDLNVELPLRAIARGYRWTTLPVHWHDRSHGATKFRLLTMAARDLWTLARCVVELRRERRSRPPRAGDR